jgi:hypothetical protein
MLLRSHFANAMSTIASLARQIRSHGATAMNLL